MNLDIYIQDSKLIKIKLLKKIFITENLKIHYSLDLC